jgi:RHS repeat-associated protein
VENDSATVCEQDIDYYPYGGEGYDYCSGSEVSRNYKFTGKERDSESGLDYFGARYNASDLGRFMSVDPSRVSIDLSNPQTLNRYSYANNNPQVYVDTNGQWSQRVHEEIIDEVFRYDLNASERQILKNTSKWIDEVSQDPAEAFKHGMRSPGEDPSVAIAETDAWIAENLQNAANTQLVAESTGHTGNDAGALGYFGIALHAVTDSTSPWHRGAGGDPLEWGELKGFGLAKGFWHGISESIGGRFSESEAKHEARVQAALLWQRYLEMLKKAREKEEAKRKKECMSNPQKCS